MPPRMHWSLAAIGDTQPTDEITILLGRAVVASVVQTFDDFLIGMEQFGQRIQPLMATRRARLAEVA